jgi:hypothetical protein
VRILSRERFINIRSSPLLLLLLVSFRTYSFFMRLPLSVVSLKANSIRPSVDVVPDVAPDDDRLGTG